MNNWFFVGLDLGQSHDFTAMAVLERVELQGEWDPVVFAYKKVVKLRLRHLERPALGTPYPDVVERVARATRSGDLRGRCHLIADATGVGRPVIDLLRRAEPGCQLMPVTITSGAQETQSGGDYHVPKRDLIVGLQVLLQGNGLQIAAGLELGPALAEELADVRVKTTLAGNEQYGAWRTGEHDDLVLAVALAYWGSKKVYRTTSGADGYCQWSGRLPDWRRALL